MGEHKTCGNSLFQNASSGTSCRVRVAANLERYSLIAALINDVEKMYQVFLDDSLGIINAPVINELAHKFSENLANRHVDLGFNVFAIVSDVYHRENLHSDVIKTFLDPTAPHGEGDQYLRTFLQFLNEIDPGVDPLNYACARVVREEGKVDILIADDETKHAVIIENKINGAPDMPRQIPRYLKAVSAAGYTCDAIIYLRLSDTRGPDQTDWSSQDKKVVANLLSVVRAYDETNSDLYSGWITRCLTNHVNPSDSYFLLRQYGLLIKSLGKHIMNKPLMDMFYAQMIDAEKYRAAISLQSMLNSLGLYRVERVIDFFKRDLEPFSSLDNYRDNVAYFTGLNIGDAHLGVDIIMFENHSTFQFWDREDQAGKNGHARTMLQKMGVIDKYMVSEGVFSMDFKFPTEENALYAHIREFKSILASIVRPSAVIL